MYHTKIRKLSRQKRFACKIFLVSDSPGKFKRLLIPCVKEWKLQVSLLCSRPSHLQGPARLVRCCGRSYIQRKGANKQCQKDKVAVNHLPCKVPHICSLFFRITALLTRIVSSPVFVITLSHSSSVNNVSCRATTVETKFWREFQTPLFILYHRLGHFRS